MAKFGIGVGEEFPVDDPPPRSPNESDADRAERRRYWRQHHYLHLATRLAVIALIVAFIVWMFIPHATYTVPAGAPRYYRHFFFPFPLLLILLFVLAWRALGHRRGHHHHHHLHDERHFRRDREEV
jgi:hypothetical protein